MIAHTALMASCGKPSAPGMTLDNSMVKSMDLELSYAVHEDSGIRYKLKIVKVDEFGKFRLSFQPKVVGIYSVHVYCKGKEIPQSPFRMRLSMPRDPSAKVIGIEGKGHISGSLQLNTQVITGLNLEEEKFLVFVSHKFKLHCGQLIGEGVLDIYCQPKSAAKISLTPIEGEKGSYHCDILPLQPGFHEISVKYNGSQILGSPFKVAFHHGGVGTKCRMTESWVDHEPCGDFLNFHISTKGAGKSKLTASVKDTSTNEKLPITLTQVSEDLYNIKFCTNDVMNECLLKVKYHGEYILGAPFKLVFGLPSADTASLPRPQGKSEPATPDCGKIEKWRMSMRK